MKHFRLPSYPLLVPSRIAVRGFALFEVMVTLVLLSAGFLAGAFALARTAREERSAIFMGRAANLAVDMAERIHLNSASWLDSGPNNDSFERSGTYASLLVVPDGTPACKGAQKGQMGLPEPATAKAECSTPTPAQIAEYDIYSWNEQVKNSLAAGAGMVIPATGRPGRFWIVVAWTEPQVERNADKSLALAESYNLNCPTSVLTTLNPGKHVPMRCYMMEVQP